MPTDPNTGAYIQAAASAVGTAASIAAQSDINRKTRQWNEKMYARQRADALSDWTMQNEYNSPEAQMQRLKMAGLNPNLVYGKGADAQMGAPVRSTDVKGWSPGTPKVDLTEVGRSVGTMYDLKIKQAQIDNLKAQNTVQLEDAKLKQAQTLATLTNNESQGFDLGLKRDLRDTSAEAARTSLEKLKTDISLSLDANDRAQIQLSSNLNEAIERVIRSRAERSKIPSQIKLAEAQIDNVRKDSDIKQLDINLKRLGIQPSDALWQRAAGQLINKYGGGIWEKFQNVGKINEIKLDSTWKANQGKNGSW